MSLGRLGRAPASISLFQPFTTSTAPSPPPSSAPSSPSFLAHHLLDEFSRPRATRDAARLRRLAAHLTPPAAESVILRLPSWRHALDFFRWAAEQPGFRHSCYSLNAMASLLSPHQRAHLDRLAGDAVASRCPMTPGALGFLLRRLGAAGLTDTAARVFDAARTTLSCTPNSYTYNCLLDALAKAGRADDAEARLREMVARCGDESVDSKWGKVEGAVELVGRMEALGMRPSEKTLSVLVHGVLIEGLCQGNKIEKAVHFFEEMKRNGVAPDVRLLKKIIETFCSEGHFTSVVPFINENAEHLKPSGVVSLYNVVLEGLVNSGDIEAAYQLLRSMVHGSERVSNDDTSGAHLFIISEGVKPNSDSFNIVVCGLYRLDEAYEIRKDPSAAIDLLREIRTNGHKPWVKNCTEMVQQLCLSGRITEALQFLDEMLKMGFLPDIITYSAAMNGMCETGKFDEAQEIMEEMLMRFQSQQPYGRWNPAISAVEEGTAFHEAVLVEMEAQEARGEADVLVDSVVHDALRSAAAPLLGYKMKDRPGGGLALPGLSAFCSGRGAEEGNQPVTMASLGSAKFV
ncbi:hypothetical protein BAE44_0004260 [Dichanthelium oligosanthes]|uniref:Pentatricopeptide repeat-containing protein n=1 Tax=Dichanthelium oligosanthes TaxID=888268 RepID=A0A1E5WBF5_9POAL|nr:hypothetical protein BAE44_0004260 [Dichanthelium oligosanthes]